MTMKEHRRGNFVTAVRIGRVYISRLKMTVLDSLIIIII